MFVLPLLIAAAPAGACAEATSTPEIVACFARRARLADARLNTAYRDARARVPTRQASALQVAQRAWIAFRDANCRAAAAGEGTVARIEGAQCLADTTAARPAELERFARRY